MTSSSSATALTAAWIAMTTVAVLAHRRRPSPRPISTTTTTDHEHRPARRRRRRPRLRDDIADAVPDVIDLFAVAIASGLNTRLALRAVAERAPPGTLTDALRQVGQDVTATGERLADTIERLPNELGSEDVRPLVSAITDAERYGARLGPTLDRLADDARRTRQRRAEEAARRIPVKLLFPLVTCILPAFGLLTVAPLIAGGLRALRL